MAGVLRLWSKFPRRSGARAWVGVLEDVIIPIVGEGLMRNLQPEEALPVIKANLALMRRHWWQYDEHTVLMTQSSLASCLSTSENHDDALAIYQEIYARRAATDGVRPAAPKSPPPRNLYVAAAASPQPASAEDLRGISTSWPRRRRDPPSVEDLDGTTRRRSRTKAPSSTAPVSRAR